MGKRKTHNYINRRKADDEPTDPETTRNKDLKYVGRNKREHLKTHGYR